jgi:hypothetical protein
MLKASKKEVIFSYLILFFSFLAITSMIGYMLRAHNISSNEVISRNNYVYLAVVLGGMTIGFAGVAVIQLIHEKLTQVARSDGKKYISYKYSYLLAMVMAVVMAVFVGVGVYQSHTLHNHVNNNRDNTAFFFNNRLVSYTLLGVSIATLVGLLVMIAVAAEHKALAVLAMFSSLALAFAAFLNFTHASTNPVDGPTAGGGYAPNISQQAQSFVYLGFGVLLFSLSIYFFVKEEKEEHHLVGVLPAPEQQHVPVATVPPPHVLVTTR